MTYISILKESFSDDCDTERNVSVSTNRSTAIGAARIAYDESDANKKSMWLEEWKTPVEKKTTNIPERL